ncbi:MAG: tetratricopeptide repeat protein [Lachnospiraceae bacterium]|nr:tetratricopeptide repeat protein [Lachnospiraceae bacterium]
MLKRNRHRISQIFRRGLLAAAVSLLLVSCGETESTDQEAYRSYGITCLEKGEYDEAVKAFQRALSVSHSVGEVEIDINMYLARAQYLAGDSEGAIETYSVLIQYNHYAAAYYQRGNLYLAIGETDKALADYDSAVDENRSDYEMYIGIYETLSASGMKDQGLAYLEKASDISGEKGKDHFYKGRIQLLLGNTDEAISLLKTAIEQNYAEANFYLATLYREQGDDTTAQSYLDAYLSSEDVDALALYNAGVTEMSAGDYESAVVFFDAVRKQSETEEVNMQSVLKNLAVAYEKLGDFESAKAILEDYVETYPEDDEASRELTFLETR